MRSEVLDKKRQEIFLSLAEFSDFYLAGGTALALQIGHRISFDFDLFSTKEISKGLLPKIKQIFAKKNVIVSVNNQNELTVFIDDIKLTFLKYPFPILNDLVDIHGLRSLDVPEIAATKAFTIGRRGSYKDYVDIYFILKEKRASLKQIIKLANKKYEDEFNDRLFLEQLVYLEDVHDENLIFLKKKVSRGELQNFLEKSISQISL